MFDFATMDTATLSEAGRRVTILHTGTGLPLLGEDGTEIWISVAGPDSARYRRSQAASKRRLLEWVQGNEKAAADDAAEFDYQNTLLFVADLVIDWHAEVSLDGEVIAATAENAARLFRRAPHVLHQLDAQASGRARFLAA